MSKLTPGKLMTLEAYAKARPAFRAQVMAHRQHRYVHLGEHVTLIFEDALTVQYQVQEMLRAERIFEEEGILNELAVYNPLIPDGSNWKATMMIEYADPAEREQRLVELTDIENRVWAEIGGHEKIYAIADEDLERADGRKTSAVHFLRFELPPEARLALRAGATLHMGISHPRYAAETAIASGTYQSLLADLTA